ncbi:ABC transporter permease [Halotalea alkalilenta]|uniref:ABC transporter n=1 Tax=Halotalea alkalilenta TaxID=376489 RepID=A0A172YCT9_9GAMM|nr:ABC transporter permease [Halotalea alkalilenta]ANF57070.1 ABC transporter [Halotalea alkalilenta]
MDLAWLDFQGYGPRLIEGGWLTLRVAVLSMVIALLLGMLTASAKLSSSALLKGVATFYTTVIRGVPDLVLMMLLFYGGQIGVNMFTDYLYDATDGRIDWFIDVDAFTAGVITIGFIFGAYMAETFRGAFMAVDAGQMEAARAYGMSPLKAFQRVRFPLMMRHALPGLGNNWMVLLKTTALVSIIGLTDMVRVADEATKATHQPFLFLLPVALGYLAIASLSELLFQWLTRRYSVGFTEAND